eukprot:jgi/Mesvir1/19265/Mv10345-RA.1
MAMKQTTAIIGFFILVAFLGWLHIERQKLSEQSRALRREMEALNERGMQKDLEMLGWPQQGFAGKSKQEECKDEMSATRCSWRADRGDCTGEVEFMMKNCRFTCKLCDGLPSPEASSSEDTSECKDLHAKCEVWALAGECQSNQLYMVGSPTVKAHCPAACGKCESPQPSGGEPVLSDRPTPDESRESPIDATEAKDKPSAESDDAEDSGGEAKPAAAEEEPCADLSPNCHDWARKGECERNIPFMIGDDKFAGQCKESCGICDGKGRPFVPAASASATTDHKLVLATSYKWPDRSEATGTVCVGHSRVPCMKKLHTLDVERVTSTDRSRVPGTGGPTGCTEAWATLLSHDRELAGVLVLIYTIRTHATVDRDIVVFITDEVSAWVIQELKEMCVVIKHVVAPFDAETHVGFVKIAFWLTVEYTKIVYVENTVWFRADPSSLFNYAPIATLHAAPHVRVVADVFNPHLFSFKPGRQTFFDMLAKVGAAAQGGWLAKVGSLDSLEVVGETTVHSDRLFFSAYFDTWTVIPNVETERIDNLVTSILAETLSTHARSMIREMPPHAKYYSLNYQALKGKGVHNDIEVMPWMPAWRIPCAWPCRYRRLHHLYEAVMQEWWEYYYQLVELPLPKERAQYKLLQSHDPGGVFQQRDYKFCIPFNCELPEDWSPKPTVTASSAAQQGQEQPQPSPEVELEEANKLWQEDQQAIRNHRLQVPDNSIVDASHQTHATSPKGSHASLGHGLGHRGGSHGAHHGSDSSSHSSSSSSHSSSHSSSSHSSSSHGSSSSSNRKVKPKGKHG